MDNNRLLKAEEKLDELIKNRNHAKEERMWDNYYKYLSNIDLMMELFPELKDFEYIDDGNSRFDKVRCG